MPSIFQLRPNFLRIVCWQGLSLPMIWQRGDCSGKILPATRLYSILKYIRAKKNKPLRSTLFYPVTHLSRLRVPFLITIFVINVGVSVPAQANDTTPHFSVKDLVYKLFPFTKPDEPKKTNLPITSITPPSPTVTQGISASKNDPSLALIMQAEFMADRGDLENALQVYKQQAFKDNATAVFERGLGLSIANEDIHDSLQFAQTWQQRHPEHVPALFYVTHLALKSHDYELAGQKLSQILTYDPDADLSQILIGIYPTDSQSQTELLTTLQRLNTRDNPSLLVMKAGLLLQFDQPKLALVEIDKALKKQPSTPAFMLLKADILQKLETTESVAHYIAQARQTLTDNKSLFLYQVRFLINQGDSDQAWQLLNSNPEFLSDDEIKLLAALVGLDVERYGDADSFLHDLAQEPNYRSQAYYYLGISAERQLLSPRAIEYYAKVTQTDLILNARKKQIALLIAAQRYDEAIASAIKLRENYDDFVVQSYILQANVLQKMGKTQAAIDLLSTANKQIPNTPSLLFARALLLPDSEQQTKRNILLHLMQIAPENVEYQLEYAQFLVNQKTDIATVEKTLSPLINDKVVGLRARQIWAQQAFHQRDYPQVISLLADSFDIKPDVVSALLLRQAYLAQNDINQAEKINQVLTNQLHYTAKP